MFFLNRTALILSVIVIIGSTLCYVWFPCKLVFGDKKTLAIGIISARENFKQRDVFRKIWSQLTDNLDIRNYVIFKFIIGDYACDIPPLLRKNPYSCERQKLVKLKQYENIPLSVISTDNLPDRKEHDIHFNISFHVRHPIVLSRLGILKDVKLTVNPLKITLFDETRETDVLIVRFSTYDVGIVKDGYRYQPVEKIILPKDFIGSLKAFSDDQIIFDDQGISIQSVSNSDGFVDIEYIDESGFVSNSQNNKVLGVSLHFSVFDIDSYETLSGREDKLFREHDRNMKLQSSRLQKESMNFNDIVFVNVTDTYRNIPKKLLKFHAWVQSYIDVDLVMKTDDDCYIDVEGILDKAKLYKSYKKLWWSNFRDDWYVERTGKWAENLYRSSSYPSFACGAGNIVSRDISQWLATNSEVLQIYQGEDVSMGIWLAAVGPRFMQDSRWKCDKNCDEDALVIPELTPEEVLWFWRNKRECGYPCSCQNL